VLTLCTTCLISPPRAISALHTSRVCLFTSAARDLFIAAGVGDADAGAAHGACLIITSTAQRMRAMLVLLGLAIVRHCC
jgi:hypothetical protein